MIYINQASQNNGCRPGAPVAARRGRTGRRRALAATAPTVTSSGPESMLAEPRGPAGAGRTGARIGGVSVPVGDRRAAIGTVGVAGGQGGRRRPGHPAYLCPSSGAAARAAPLACRSSRYSPPGHSSDRLW
jgi:hypothetical protein